MNTFVQIKWLNRLHTNNNEKKTIKIHVNHSLQLLEACGKIKIFAVHLKYLYFIENHEREREKREKELTKITLTNFEKKWLNSWHYIWDEIWMPEGNEDWKLKFKNKEKVRFKFHCGWNAWSFIWRVFLGSKNTHSASYFLIKQNW